MGISFSPKPRQPPPNPRAHPLKRPSSSLNPLPNPLPNQLPDPFPNPLPNPLPNPSTAHSRASSRGSDASSRYSASIKSMPCDLVPAPHRPHGRPRHRRTKSAPKALRLHPSCLSPTLDPSSGASVMAIAPDGMQRPHRRTRSDTSPSSSVLDTVVRQGEEIHEYATKTRTRSQSSPKSAKPSRRAMMYGCGFTCTRSVIASECMSTSTKPRETCTYRQNCVSRSNQELSGDTNLCLPSHFPITKMMNIRSTAYDDSCRLLTTLAYSCLQS